MDQVLDAGSEQLDSYMRSFGAYKYSLSYLSGADRRVTREGEG